MNTVRIIEGVTMVSIPSGNFLMGHEYRYDPAQSAKVNRYFPDEQPVHQVAVKAFMLGEAPITQSQFEAVMGKEANRSAFRGNDLPVTNLGPHEIIPCCNKLSLAAGLQPCYNETVRRNDPNSLIADRTKNGFRLPTEEEWEYACRAGSAAHFSSGNTERDLDRVGWYLGNSDRRLHPVKQKRPNSWGLYDMHGNVSEFCDDDWNPSMAYLKYLTDQDTVRIYNYYHSMKITRGGSWFSEPAACRSAARACFCDWANMNGWYNGFRVACSVQQ